MGLATSLRTHTCGSLRSSDAGATVTLAGWVHSLRDHGGVTFVDLRDRYGITQIVRRAGPGTSEPELNSEDVLRVTGTVALRPAKLQNPKLPTGEVEVQAREVAVLSRAATPPFEIAAAGPVGEETRLQYRYLDLRKNRMQRNLELRDRFLTAIRSFLHGENFLEVETPILTKSTPEGARDFLVPARLHQGSFYALPQSPQQYKQLLMVAGFDRYFQIARCFRDEDQRGDRQPEFTQLDLEMSFVGREDILTITERLFTKVLRDLGFTVAHYPFPRLTHAKALAQYGTDTPDLRSAEEKASGTLTFVWILDFPLFEKEEPAGVFHPSHHVFTSPLPEDLPLLQTEPAKVRGTQYDLVCNGHEVGGGSIRIHDPSLQERIFALVGLTTAEARAQFGHLLEAFTYGVPPHGGIAPGIDRLLMVALAEPTIREVIAFPKNQQAFDPMMGTPAPVAPAQLDELGLTFRAP